MGFLDSDRAAIYALLGFALLGILAWLAALVVFGLLLLRILHVI